MFKFLAFLWQCSCWFFWLKLGQDVMYFIQLFEALLLFATRLSFSRCFKYIRKWTGNFGIMSIPSTWMHHHIAKSGSVFFEIIEKYFAKTFLSCFEVNGNISNSTPRAQQINCCSRVSFTLCHLTRAHWFWSAWCRSAPYNNATVTKLSSVSL